MNLNVLTCTFSILAPIMALIPMKKNTTNQTLDPHQYYILFIQFEFQNKVSLSNTFYYISYNKMIDTRDIYYLYCKSKK